MELGKDRTVAELISRLQTAKPGEGAVRVEGTWGSFARLLTAYISNELNRPVLYICPHIEDADKAADDLLTFGAQKIQTLPAWEGAEDLADATDEIRAERLKLVSVLSSLAPGHTNHESQLIVPASIQAICQPVPEPKTIQAGSLKLQINNELPPQNLTGWLIDNGFERVDRIDLPGQFAHRGGIVDIYAPLTLEKITSDDELPNSYEQTAQAIRVEFFADTIESIRRINLDTHRSTTQLKSISIVSAVTGTAQDQRELFLNILPADTIIILDEPNDIEDVANVFLDRVENPDRLYCWTDIYKKLADFTQLHICRFAPSATDEFIKVDIKSVQQFQQKTTAWTGHKAALEQLVTEAKQGKKVCIYCEASAEITRLTEIINQIDNKIPRNLKLIKGFINQGFIISSLNTIIISHHELFGQFAIRRRQRPALASSPVETLEDLQRGDYVVHASYGIGKFLGIKTIKEKDSQSEYLTIEYADRVKIQVSATNIALIQKFIGTSPKRPGLSKIGSKKWLKQKQKVADSVKDLAAELLEVQARRQATGGITFGTDSNWQTEFEQSFPYTETADQTISADQIKTDMQENIAMDRLLCGDVGYGKTELAMRCAFKAIEGGKQVAMLVPTTVLSIQHGRTFTERFADFPVSIEVLNRFKTSKQAVDIITRTKQGKVDILIGTHRLLSGDIGFKDLGLLIIDEEQRFGVEHKEKLKKLRINVDILTMTATPIPRTLHMSLLGLRDISSLGTPPLDRRSIVTSVTAYNPALIRKAIIAELNRQGQVFFVHNRVKTIDRKAWEIKKLIEDTDAKITVAHGQMPKSELEKAMIDFVIGKTDILVCTTIIESGLDIPNANTIFIDNADRFGLAELHQLRGRVGRYKHRAYAYMLLPNTRPITPIAARRLKAIEEYSHLGAGFRIALRDLEIRGAGNILGPEQSGHIQLVGYQMYCQLLAEAVSKLKGEFVEPIPTTSLDIGLTAYIPKNYIPLDRHRMDAYRKIAIARTDQDIKQIADELIDVYGPIPEEVNLLFELAELRIAATRFNIKSIITSGQNFIFSFTKNPGQKVKTLLEKTSGKITIPDAKTVYLRLDKSYFQPQTLLTILRKILCNR